MRIFLVIDETNFYHPDYTADLIRYYGRDLVGVALVTKISRRNSIEKYLIRNSFYLTLPELTKLVVKKILFIFKDRFYERSTNGKFYSVKSVLAFFNIYFFNVEFDINRREYIEKIKEVMPDVIISSNSLFFGKEIIRIPPLGCINRHSGLLPSYGGLWPVFQAVRNNESFVGVTIHKMNDKIDEGTVLYQKEIQVMINDTIYSLYGKCFKNSVIATVEALKCLRENKDMCHQSLNNHKPSYYSFPTKEHWVMFRRTKKSFI